MIIDRSHRVWAVTSTGIIVSALLLYAPYTNRPEPPSGGSALGLAYGIVGFGMMVYAGLLAGRKKVPVWRLGRAQTWMRGHLWLGLVSLPLILFHAGFTFGGPLTAVLMWLLLIVVFSGLLGAYLQHTLPRRILANIPMETIYEQIDHVRAQLVEEADAVVADACGKLEIEAMVPTAGGALGGSATQAGGAATSPLATIVRIDADDTAPLQEFYLREMRLFVQQPTATHDLADPERRRVRFDKVRALLPARLHGAVSDLESICEEERQLMHQLRMHAWLHGWLLVHAPLSFALLALAVVHVVVALRF